MMNEELKPIDPTKDIEQQIKQHQQHRINTGEGVRGCYCAGCVEIPTAFAPTPKVNDEQVKDGSMFTNTEEKTFDANIQYRQALLEDIFKGGIPKDNSTRRIVIELLSSVDSAFLTRAKLRYSIKANEEDKDVRRDTADILRAMIQQRISDNTTEPIDIPTALPEKFENMPLNEGALKLGHDAVSVKDFFDEED